MTDKTLSEMEIQAELTTASATLRVVRFSLADQVDTLLPARDCYQINQCLDPRPLESRGCFVDQWGPRRFEPVGEIFLVPPAHRLHMRSLGGRQHAVVVEIDAGLVDSWTDSATEWTDRRLAAALNIIDPNIRHVLGRCSGEAMHRRLASPALVEALIQQLSIDIARYVVNVPNEQITGGLSAWRLRIIDDRLGDLDSPPTLAELAALCGLSVRQLTRGFRGSRGISIKEHLGILRIDYAKRMLASDHNIKTIASALGYATASAFSHAFRSATGVTPNYFRGSLVRAPQRRGASS